MENIRSTIPDSFRASTGAALVAGGNAERRALYGARQSRAAAAQL